jgi:hypothetical protein
MISQVEHPHCPASNEFPHSRFFPGGVFPARGITAALSPASTKSIRTTLADKNKNFQNRSMWPSHLEPIMAFFLESIAGAMGSITGTGSGFGG